MANFWQIVDDVIYEADILLMVVDARLIKETYNEEIVEKVKSRNKPLITVVNKADLVEKSHLEKYKQKYHPCVFVSATQMLGTTLLKKAILKESKGESCRVGVLGYPNTGKSSVINALRGRASAKVSSISGYTTGRQIIRASKIVLLDTPGVIPYSEKDDHKHIIIATKNFYDSKDPDIALLALIEETGHLLFHHYDVKKGRDDEETLENFAKKLNRFKKGGIPDIETSSKIILKDWQQGKIKVEASFKKFKEANEE